MKRAGEAKLAVGEAAGAASAGLEAVVPRVIVHAAKVYGKNPKKLGEVIIALVGGVDAERGLDEGQGVVLALCREELADAAAKRRRERERKARWRSCGASAAQPSLFDAEEGRRAK